MEKHRVALYRGDDRHALVSQSLEAISSDIDVAGKERIIIKPNFVTVHRQAAATHVDAVRAVVEMLWSKGVRKASLVAGPALGTTEQGFRNYGYLPLIEEYGLDVIDLNHDDAQEVELLDAHQRPMRLPVARTVLESDYRISVGPPKTHDFAIVTLSLKNFAVGALLSGRKGRSHPDVPTMNINLYKLAKVVAPHLSVIDGFVAMEGNGPVSGDPVDWRTVITSAHWLAADALTASLMGYEPETLGWLNYCMQNDMGISSLDDIALVGNISAEQARRQFKHNPHYAEELHWQIPAVAQYF